MECFNEPLNLCTKNTRSPRDNTSERTDVDYDDVCLATQSKNCDKKCDNATKTNGVKSTSPVDVTDASDDVADAQSTYGTFTHSVNGAFNPNLLLQHHQLEQYLLLQQHQQTQQQLIDGSMAKMHLDKYLKLTNRYLHTMSPFLQHFTPLVGQGPAAINVQAAANAAASLLLANNQTQCDESDARSSPKTPESPESAGSNNDSVRFFLHKLIEHNFLQQLQQQQQINDLINNNNNQSSNNNGHNHHNSGSGGGGGGGGSGGGGNNKTNKSPCSNDGDSEFYNHHLMQATPTNAKTFFDFLKNAAANSAAAAGTGGGSGGGGGNNGNTNRGQQGYKRQQT